MTSARSASFSRGRRAQPVVPRLTSAPECRRKSYFICSGKPGKRFIWLARCTVSRQWLRARRRKYMGAPGGVKADRGTGSSRSRVANHSGGGGDDDIRDKLAAPVRRISWPVL